MSKEKYPATELDPRLLGTSALNIGPGMMSAPRLQFFGSQIKQTPPIKHPTRRRTFTGMESKYGEFTHGVTLPKDIRVLKTIQRFPRGVGLAAIKRNPETIVIYEYDETENGRTTNVVNYVSLIGYHTMHQQFGFEYVDGTPIQEYMPEGTILKRSPNITEDGDYLFGVEAEMAMFSHPQSIEDGMVVSETFAKRAEALAVETYIISYGSTMYPLNMYGDESDYKCFPDIGDKVREDGILMALREYDDEKAPVAMSTSALRQINHGYDRPFYIPPGSEILDVKVFHDERKRGVMRSRTLDIPVGMYDQTDKYRSAQHTFYKNIVDFYKSLYGRRGEGLKLHPNFHRLVVEALGMSTSGESQRLSRTYRGKPLDEWQVEIIVKHPIELAISSKLSGTSGDKGIVVDIWPDERMPVDASGNRADIFGDGISTTKRMNTVRLAEQYINACTRDLTNRLRADYKKGRNLKEISDEIVSFYKVVSPHSVAMVVEKDGYMSKETIEDSLSMHVEDLTHYTSREVGIQNHIPPNKDGSLLDICRELREKFPATYGPISYVNENGERIVTKNPVLIGSIYTLTLDKTGFGWAGVGSSKLNLFGVPAKITMVDKFTSPGRQQPIKIGETEIRSYSNYIGGRATADFIDCTHNPVVRKHIQEAILAADKPTNIDMLVDRTKLPSGNGRLQQMIKHVALCNGYRFIRDGKVK